MRVKSSTLFFSVRYFYTGFKCWQGFEPVCGGAPFKQETDFRKKNQLQKAEHCRNLRPQYDYAERATKSTTRNLGFS